VKGRNTLIIRDIPSQTPEEEVKAIFANTEIKVIETKSDIGDNWYVTFDSDEEALRALEKMKELTFNEKPLKARVKTDNTFRTLQIPQEGSLPPGGYVYAYRGDLPTQIGEERTEIGLEHNGDLPDGRNFSRRERGYKKKDNSRGQGKGHKGGAPPKESGGRKRRASGSNIIQLDHAGHFPPLPSSGYNHDFKKYSPEEILSIFKWIKDFSKPNNLPDCKIILSEPNMDLAYKKSIEDPITLKPEVKKPSTPTKSSDQSKGVWSHPRFTKNVEH